MKLTYDPRHNIAYLRLHEHESFNQSYLGKVTDTKAIRWIDNLYS